MITPSYCTAIGDNAQANESNYQITCNFVGLGMRSTVMTPEEHAVVKNVILRMMAEDIKETGELYVNVSA